MTAAAAATNNFSKLEIIRAYQLKKRKELWCKALGEKGSFEQALQDKDFTTVAELKQGKFNLSKVPKLALEVVSVETVGNCF